MHLTDLENKKILILGYGKEGQETYRFLKKRLPGSVIGTADQSDGEDYLNKQKDYDIVIRSPGIQKEKITKPYTTATNLFFSITRNRIIGVTGSKGKTTTASLIHHILKTAGLPSKLAGNIGTPMLSLLDQEKSPDDIYVIELSSYQLDDIEYSPHVSVILNLFPEHMDYHGNIERYYAAKKNILSQANESDYFVFNPVYPILLKWSQDTRAKPVPFKNASNIDPRSTKLIGKHNLENISAASTVAHIFGVSQELIKQAVYSFTPVKHRLENIGSYNGITFYDDAISTTPQSTIAALEALPNVGTLFLGGKDRGYDFSKLAEVIVNMKIKAVVLFPESGSKILSEIKKITADVPRYLETTSMKDAVVFAYEQSPAGSVCLLSTASPSYSLWKNFEEKGDQFRRFVMEYAQFKKA